MSRAIRLVAGCLVVVMAASPHATAADVQHIVVEAEADAFLRAGAPNTNEGANPVLRLQASGNNRILVRFDLDDVASRLQGKTLRGAYLEMCIADNAGNWGRDGDRTIDLHRVQVPWEEGNGVNSEVPRRFRDRGDFEGVTWNCPVDFDVSNQRPDGDLWNGGFFDEMPIDSVVMTNQMDVGTRVYWDVTDALLDDLDVNEHHGWLLKKTNERAPGKVLFASREFDAFLRDPYQEDVDPVCTDPMLVLDVAEDVEQLVLLADRDTDIRSGSANKNQGADHELQVRASGNNRVLVGFDLDGLPTEGLIKATLTLTIFQNFNNWGSADEELAERTVDAHRLLVDWTEGNSVNGEGATWNAAKDPNISNSSP